MRTALARQVVDCQQNSEHASSHVYVAKLLKAWTSLKEAAAPDYRRAASIIQGYRRLDEGARCALLCQVAGAFCLADTEEPIRRAIASYSRADSAADRWRALWELREAIDAPLMGYFAPIETSVEALRFVLDLRVDAARFARTNPRLRILDQELKGLLLKWFDPGFLTTRRIRWDSSAALLEKLIKYEAVHPIGSWDDLRDRLDTDRRCYGVFHPAMEDEPLAFVEVALVEHIEGSIQSILDQRAPARDPRSARVALFYSISNTQPGLQGFGIGRLLIERTLQELKQELPQLKLFATLSPVPLLCTWLENNPDEVLAALREDERRALAVLGSHDQPHAALIGVLRNGVWHKTPEIEQTLQPIILRIAARFVLGAKRNGDPWDPVARFHLENGAKVDRIHWLANTSERGLRQSAGVMVSYLYEPTKLQQNRLVYKRTKVVRAARSVRQLVRQHRKKQEGINNAVSL